MAMGWLQARLFMGRACADTGWAGHVLCWIMLAMGWDGYMLHMGWTGHGLAMSCAGHWFIFGLTGHGLSMCWAGHKFD
jgi:hypothetical protein